MIDTLFDFGVWSLVEAARLLGMTYEEINVVIFMVIWPLHIVATGWLIWLVLRR